MIPPYITPTKEELEIATAWQEQYMLSSEFSADIKSFIHGMRYAQYIEESAKPLGYEELKSLFEKAVTISESPLSDEAKYNLIFSENISQKTDFEWYCPDMGYNDDYWAYISAFREYLEGDAKIIHEITNNQ